jgi:NADPH-dependent ferric siderophore reductase
MTTGTDTDGDEPAPLAPRLRTHLTRVVRAEQRTPHVRRITLGGGDLATFAALPNPDQFVHLLLAPPGRSELTVDDAFTWEGFYAMSEADRPVGAYYTVRHHRPARAEIDIDVVLHGDGVSDGGGVMGPASAWARSAQPGDPVALWGPRTTFTPPQGRDGTAWYLLVADETGLPATAAIVDWLPTGAVAHVLIEVPDVAEEQPLFAGPGMRVHWLHRDGAPPGTTTALVDAVRALDLPAGGGYAWGGGESRAMTAVRRYLRRERDWRREDVSLTPYWRHAAHEHDPDDEHE